MDGVNVVFRWPLECCNSTNRTLMKELYSPEPIAFNMADVEPCYEVHGIISFRLYINMVL